MTKHDVNLSTPHIKAILAAVTAAVDGLTTRAVGHLFNVSDRNAKRSLGAMRIAGMIVVAGSGPTSVWCVRSKKARVEARILRATAAKQVAQRARDNVRRKYTPMDGDTPIIRRVVQTWPAPQRAPGPVSIFQLGAL